MYSILFSNMPDYSKTIIYKIQHEDDESLVYVGSTTNFTRRKCEHKKCKKHINLKHYLALLF